MKAAKSKIMFTNEKIKRIAMAQSAIDIGCHADDFLKSQTVVSDFNLGIGNLQSLNN